MTATQQYKVFEFVLRYYMLINGCKLTGKISPCMIDFRDPHLRIKSYIRAKNDKGNQIKTDLTAANRAAQNEVLPFAVNLFNHDPVIKNRHVEFMCRRDKVRNLKETKNYIRSLKGHKRFAI